MSDLKEYGVSARGRGRTHHVFNMDAKDVRKHQMGINKSRQQHSDDPTYIGILNAAENLAKSKVLEEARGLSDEAYDDVMNFLEEEHPEEQDNFFYAQPSWSDIHVKCAVDDDYTDIGDIESGDPDNMDRYGPKFRCVVGNPHVL